LALRKYCQLRFLFRNTTQRTDLGGQDWQQGDQLVGSYSDSG
jgi:hypothetical protein